VERFDMRAATDQALLDNLEKDIARRERRGLILTIVIALSSVAAAAAFLLFTYYKLSEASSQLDSIRAEMASRQQQLASVTKAKEDAETALDHARTQIEEAKKESDRLKIQLTESNQKLLQLESQIRESADLVQFLHPIDFADAKNLYNTSPKLGDLLAEILQLKDRNLHFSFANNPQDGFTSPGFAGYILQKLRRLPQGMPPDAALRTLPAAAEPQLGDIVQYETGFALFYLKDHRNQPFVIGMTPKGIAALKPDFRVKRIGVLRTGL
jgi:hypothetical protein